jgi:hypothetical protein
LGAVGLLSGGPGSFILSSGTDSPVGRLGAGLWRGSGLLLKEVRNYERSSEELAAAAEAPFPEAIDKTAAIENRMGAVRQSTAKAILRGQVFSALMLPAALRLMANEAAAQAKLHAARLALGCRLYRLKFGKYPEKLAELTEKFPERFKALPTDPFSGKPFLYKRTESGCVVWSVGEDRTDDGGAVLPPANAKSYYKTADTGFELKR